MSRKTPERTELSRRDTWQLEDIYASAEAWEQEYAVASKEIKELSAFEGKLGEV